MKNSTTLPSVAKFFNSLRDENDETIYTYNDEYMRPFVRQCLKGIRCVSLNPRYKSSLSDKVFDIILEKLNVNGKVCENIDKFFEYTNKLKKTEKKYDSQFKDYRDNNEEERIKHINKELNKLTIQKNLQKLNLKDVLMDLDATSLYPSDMWDEKSVYPKKESGFHFEPYMNDVYVKAFINQTFNQEGNESAILKIKYYNPPDLIFRHLPIKEKVKSVDVSRMRNGNIIDRLTLVYICEIFKIGGKVIQFYEGVIYRENFKISPFRKVMEKFFALRQKHKDEHNGLMQN